MAADDFQPWTVYYKAVADFSDLIAEAAKARAELAALTKSLDGVGKDFSAEAAKAAKSQELVTRSILDEKTAMDTAVTAAKSYDRWVLYGGRESMAQHLTDLQKEEQLTRLLNIQKQRGFFTPMQDYAFRQREYQQLLLWNRAEMMGYQTPQQYLTYLTQERTAFEGMTKAWTARDQAIAAALATMSSYADKFGALSLNPRQLAQANKALDAYQLNISQTPDQLRTSTDLLGLGPANASLDAYQLNLSQTPDEVTTKADFDDSAALTRLAAWQAALRAASSELSVGTQVRIPLGAGSPQALPPGTDTTTVTKLLLPPGTQKADSLLATTLQQITAAEIAMKAAAIPAAAATGSLGDKIDQTIEAAKGLGELSVAGLELLHTFQDMAKTSLEMAKANDELAKANEDVADTNQDVADTNQEVADTLDDTTAKAFGAAAAEKAYETSTAKTTAAQKSLTAGTQETTTSLTDEGNAADRTSSFLNFLSGYQKDAGATAASAADDQAKFADSLKNTQQESDVLEGKIISNDEYLKAMAADSASAAGENDHLGNSFRDLGLAASAAAGSASGGGGKGGGGGSGLLGAAGAAAAGGAAARRAYGAWGLLGGRIALFGGATFIAGWHLAADVLIEFAAVAIPAIITALASLGAYMTAAFATYSAAYSHFYAQIVTTAATKIDLSPFKYTGSGPAGLSGGTITAKQLEKLTGLPTVTRLDFTAQAVQPSVMQQLGEVLDVMKTGTGEFNNLAISTANSLDRFTARIVYDFDHSGGALNNFLDIGKRDLTAFGHVFSAFGTLFMNFVKATEITHVAEDLLNTLAVVLKFAAGVTNALGPVGLALLIGGHALFVYGGIAVTALKGMAVAGLGLTSVLSKLGGPFQALNGFSYDAAKSLGATNDQLIKIAARAPGIQAIGDATNLSTADIAKLQVETDKAGDSLYDMARGSTAGQEAMAKFGSGLDDAGLDAVALTGYLGRSDEEIGHVADSMAKTATQSKGFKSSLSDLGNTVSNLAGGWHKAGGESLILGEDMDKAASRTGLLAKASDGLLAFFSGPTGILVSFAAAAVVYGIVADKIITATDATDRFIAAINSGLATAPIWKLAPQLATDFLNVSNRLEQANVAAGKLESTFLGFKGFSGVSGMEGLSALSGLPHLLAPIGPALEDISKASDDSSGHLSVFGRVGATALHSLIDDIPGVGQAANKLLNLGGAATQAAHDSEAFQAEQHLLGQQLTTVISHTSQLGALFGGNLSKGIGAATLAGITNSQMLTTNAKDWAIAMIQVKAMISGYEQFGQKAGALGNDIDAVTYAQSDQLKMMQQLNQAWDTFSANVAAPRTTFIAFAQSIVAMGQDAKQSGASMTGLGGEITKAAATVSNRSLTLQQDFQNTYSDAEQMLDALRTSGAPASVFDGVVKNLVQVLLPLAGQSRAAHAEISVLAQEAGGPASQNLKTLSEWAGKTKNPMLALQSATNKTTEATANLAQQTKLVSESLQSYVNQAIVVAELKTLGFAGALNTLTEAQKKYGDNSLQAQEAQQKLNNIINKAQNAASAYTQDNNGLTASTEKYQTALNNSEGARTQMINDLAKSSNGTVQSSKDLQNYTDMVLTNQGNTQAGHAARAQLVADLISAGDKASYANSLVTQYTKEISENANATDNAHAARQQMITDFQGAGQWGNQAKFDLNAYTIMVDQNKEHTQAGHDIRQQLIADLTKATGSAKLAKEMVNEYTTALTKIPANKPTHITVTGTGSWSVSSQPAANKPGPQKKAPGAAAGGYIDMTAGTKGQDSVPAMLMPGEYVVKTSAVQKYGTGVLDAINSQKLAGGGVVGSDKGSPSQVGTWTDTEDTKTVTAIEAAVAAAVAAQIKADEAASYGGPSPAGVRTVAKYIMAHGGTRAAGAGVGGVVAGESGGDPESIEAGGGGGAGILQWTPESSAAPIQPIITGNSGRDMGVQLVDMLHYIDGRGGIGMINLAGATGGPMGAADVFSRMEGPAVPGSDIRASVVASLYAEGLASGGLVQPGGTNKSSSVNPGGPNNSGPAKYWVTAQEAAWLKSHHKPLWGKGTGKHPYYTNKAGWDWLEQHLPKGKGTTAANPGGSDTNLAQKYDKYYKAMQTSMGDEEKAYKSFIGASWPHGKQSGKIYKPLEKAWLAQQTSIEDVWGKVAAGSSTPTSITASDWSKLSSRLDVARKMGNWKEMQVMAKRHPDDFAGLHTKIKAAEGAVSTADYYWNKLYGPGGIDAVHNGPPTPGVSLLVHGGQTVPVPNISALLPASPVAPAYAGGGLVGLGAGLMNAQPSPGFTMPSRFAAGGLVLPTPERGVAPGAAGVAGTTKSAGPLIGTMNINNPAPEPASGSITRGVQRAAFLAGRGEV